MAYSMTQHRNQQVAPAPPLQRLLSAIRWKTRETSDALGGLWKAIGWRALPVLAEVAWRKVKGEPWRGLPEPTSDKERASRVQVEPVVLMYRALSRRLDQDRALALTKNLVLSAGVHFLDHVMQEMSLQRYEDLDTDGKDALLTMILDRFPNTTAYELRVRESGFEFDVQGCAFVGLVRQVGHPELGPLFCAVDDVFFATRFPEIEFTRTKTLMKGNSCCDFGLKIREAQPGESATR